MIVEARSAKAGQLGWLVCLGTAVACGYFLLRCELGVVWDDSPNISAMRYDYERTHYSDSAEPARALLRDSFGQTTAAGYRPLTLLQHNLARWIVAEQNGAPEPWYAFGAALLGLLAICFFLVARRFTATPAGAFLAVFLLLFSTPVLTGAWPVIFNCQAIVPLTICTGLLLYWRSVEAPGYRSAYAAGLFAVMFVGPWLREFIGILPLLIATLELQRARRPSWLMGLAGVCFLQALFPTALMHWFAFPDLPLKPVFALGNLAAQLQQAGDPIAGSWLSGQLQRIKWDASCHFLVLYPPLLFLLAWLAYGVQVLHRAASVEPRSRLRRVCCFVLPCLYAAVCVGLGLLQRNYNVSLLALGLVFGVALIALEIDRFLTVWFLLSFLPFLKVFTEQVHLAYSLLPASIILAAVIEKLYVREAAGWRRGARYLATAVLALAVVDHGLNLYASWHAVAAMDGAVVAVARWFEANVPPGSAVVANALHLEDIRLASKNHFSSYWTVAAGIPADNRGLTTAAKLEQLLQAHRQSGDVYFLDIDFDYLPSKVGYHSHQYVRKRNVALESLGLVHVLRSRHPYVDPFKRFVPRRYLSFLGPPDLENDYYNGPAQDGTPFLREVYAEYHVYRVAGTRVDSGKQ
jgi:hypothetical protein